MLRPPGFGNLQGYLGYATSLLGLPLDLLLGVHNDGNFRRSWVKTENIPSLDYSQKFILILMYINGEKRWKQTKNGVIFLFFYFIT
jgi:hypothetical protein